MVKIKQYVKSKMSENGLLFHQKCAGIFIKMPAHSI